MSWCLQNKEERAEEEREVTALSPSAVSTRSLPLRHGGLVSRDGVGVEVGSQTPFPLARGLWDAAGCVVTFSLGWGQGLASSEQETETERHTDKDREVQSPVEPLGAYNNLSHPCSVLTTMVNRHSCYLYESGLQN